MNYLLTNREGKEGGGKGPLISEEMSLPLSRANNQVLFKDKGPTTRMTNKMTTEKHIDFTGIAPLRMATVCSSIGAPEVAALGLPVVTVWSSEIEPFPCRVLKEHYPGVPNLGDMTQLFTNETFINEPIELLVGGTPCQSFSIAGLRGGLDDERGNLALVFARILLQKQPRWFLWENVPGIFSSYSIDKDSIRKMLRADGQILERGGSEPKRGRGVQPVPAGGLGLFGGAEAERPADAITGGDTGAGGNEGSGPDDSEPEYIEMSRARAAAYHRENIQLKLI